MEGKWGDKMASLSLSHITMFYNSKVKALDDVSLDIEDGEFFVILGPSGSGKTTILRVIAGLEQPSQGSVIMDGLDITNYPPRERDIAMVFQNYALYPYLTVRQNLEFPLKARKMLKKDIDERVEEVAHLLQISELLDRKPGEISGGQRQRVALGRAIIRKPKLFLMDEPLSNLDAKLRGSMRTELKTLQKNLRVTTVYVTHDQIEALTLGNRTALINLGRVVQVGKPEEVFNKPKNSFVASFLGDPPINFLRATISMGKTTNLVIGKTEFTIPGTSALNKYKDKEVILAVRPDDISFSNDGLEGEIISASLLGRIVHYVIKLRETGERLEKVETYTGDMKKEGSKIKLTFALDRILLYDIDTQELIS
ncbi:MAG: ABC transporter ATP-binding protein [Thermoplasmatales archaeon]